MKKKVFFLLMGLVCFLLSVGMCQTDVPPKEIFEQPLGLPPIEWPADNPYSAMKAELGRLLFSDVRLSSDNSVACSSCHSLPKAFTDHLALAKGIHGRVGARHTPSLINVAYNSVQFWDGRMQTLEEQALGPIGNPNEMTLENDLKAAYQSCESKMQMVEEYRPLFKAVFGEETCTMENISKAIATFERTIVSGNSAFDRYQAGDSTALTDEQIHGFEIFKGVGCAACHRGPNFTSNHFANIGVGMDKLQPDLGRYEVTQLEKDWGVFKVPTLREVSVTGPYMHDGSLQTLEEVVAYYNRGGIPNANLNPLVRPLHLSEQDQKDLVSFLTSLNGEGWQLIMPFPVDKPLAQDKNNGEEKS